MIIPSGSKGYEVRSKTGKRLSKKHLSKKKAKERLKQIEYFKHKNTIY